VADLEVDLERRGLLLVPDQDSSISSMISLVMSREYLSFQRSSNQSASLAFASCSATSMLSSRLLNRPAPVKLEEPT
jgi:hypothetical protein